MTPIQMCYEVVNDWTATAYRHQCFREGLPEENRPNWNKLIPTVQAAKRMQYVLCTMRDFIGDDMLLRGTLWLTNDANSGCILIVQADAGQRVVAKVLHDGTLDMRYYRDGVFKYGRVLWPDGHESDFFDEPLEVL